MRRRQAFGAIGAILAAAVAPALIPKERLMSLKLVREVTGDEIDQYCRTPWDPIINNLSQEEINRIPRSSTVRYFHGWEYSHSESGRDYYKTVGHMKRFGDLGVAPTPAEMDMLNIDPGFARPVFVPKEKQFVDHRSTGPVSSANLRTFDEIAKEGRDEICEGLNIDVSQRHLYPSELKKDNG